MGPIGYPKEYDVENYAQAGIGGDTCFLRPTNKTDEHTDCKNIQGNFYSS